MREPQTAVFLLGFGAPNSLEEIELFLRNVFSGQEKVLPPHTFDRYLEETVKRYKAIGSKSPLLDITRLQARALEKKLNEGGNSFKVYIGMRNCHPFIGQTLKSIFADGARKIVVLSLSPQYNSATTGSNIRELKRNLNRTSTTRDIIFVDSWCNNPTYLDALSDKVRQSLFKISKLRQDQVPVLFSAHSLPKRLIERGDPYLRELEETIAGIVKRVGNLDWQLCFQSRGREGEWLGPDVSEVVERLGEAGYKEILVVPISFIADNVEILYDIDVALRKLAGKVGITKFRRTDSLNDSPKLIEALAQIVLECALKIN